MRALPVVSVLALALAAPAPVRADEPAPGAPPPPPGAPPPGDVEEPPRQPPNLPPAPIFAPARPRPAIEEIGEEPALARRRYGYRLQVIAADGAAVLSSFVVDRMSADGGSRPGAVTTLTIASYLFTPPLIHGLHRQGWRALASFGLRAGAPLVLGALGELVDGTEDCNNCKDTLRSKGKLAGLTAGVLIAMAVDGVWFARPIYRRVEVPRTAWVPAVGGARGGATVGLAGTF
jgi:hypothetical protein